MFSNNTSPLNIEEGDRRYFVFDSKAQPRGDDYYEALHQYVATAVGMNEIYTYLKRRDLSHFKPHKRPPMTAAKQQVITDSQHPLRYLHHRGSRKWPLSADVGSRVHLGCPAASVRTR